MKPQTQTGAKSKVQYDKDWYEWLWHANEVSIKYSWINKHIGMESS